MSDKKKRPDRYTCLEFTRSNGMELVLAAKTLGLKYLVTGGVNGGDVIYIFFDNEGVEKFMKGEWD